MEKIGVKIYMLCLTEDLLSLTEMRKTYCPCWQLNHSFSHPAQCLTIITTPSWLLALIFLGI